MAVLRKRNITIPADSIRRDFQAENETSSSGALVAAVAGN
jgi:hypothetical protein